MKSATIVEARNFKGAKKTIRNDENKKTKNRDFHRSKPRLE
jgi:hypothetical protein